MTLALTAGWVAQATALGVVYTRLKRDWYRHLGAIFLLLAVTFHGLGEALYRLFPEQNTYRLNVAQPDQINFFLAISAAILVLAVAYVISLGKQAETHDLDLDELRHYFDWRVMALLTAPLVAFTFAGTGRIAFDQNNAQQQTLNSGLTGQFLLIGLTFTAVAVVLRFGPRLLIPALLVQTLILASIGQRTGVVVGVAMLLYAMARIGVRLSRRTGVIIGVLAMLMLLIITASRETTGREAFEAGEAAGGRFSSLAAGAGNIFSEDTRNGLELTASYRLDGNAFPSLQLAQINNGRQGMGIAPSRQQPTPRRPERAGPEQARPAARGPLREVLRSAPARVAATGTASTRSSVGRSATSGSAGTARRRGG